MDQQRRARENKGKKSRSAARHLRRKKLVAARREVEKNTISPSSNSYRPTTSFQQEYLGNESSSITFDKKLITKIDANNIKCTIDDKESDCFDHLNIKQYISTNETVSSCIGLLKKANKICSISHSNLKVPTEICVPSSFSLVDSTVSSETIHLGQNFLTVEMDSQKKSKEQVKAEREAKKLAKAAAKAKAKVKDDLGTDIPVQSVPDKWDHQEKRKFSVKLSNSENICANLVATKIITSCDKKNLETVGETSKTGEKGKAELRAERRAKQETQRAAKQTVFVDKKKQVEVMDEKIQKKTNVTDEMIKKSIAKSEVKDNAHEVNLFKHLYLNRRKISEVVNQNKVNLHPAILRLGVQYAEKTIVGSNARCVALLAAVKQLIQDFDRPSQADFTRGLETSLQESINYLNFCRPSAVAVQNALKHLKWQMSTLSSTTPDNEAKSLLLTAIDTYIQEQILLAGKAISNAIQQKISNGDVILTYGFSSLITKILCDAYDAQKKFRVIIIDGRPWLEGKELLRRLMKHGIDCSYMLINAMSFIMPQVSKVFLGAHAILANGAVMSRVGTAQIALMANAFNVPVLVACETHKSCERVQTDSIVYNEIGDPDLLVRDTFASTKKSYLSNWKSKKTLNLLNITYDVTPADLVTAVVTELAILPCTSVPVILRIKPSEI